MATPTAVSSTIGIDLAPAPVGMSADQTAAWVITIAGFASLVAALIAALVITRRTGSPLFALLVLGGSLFIVVEPLLDILGGVWYPADFPLHAFTLFGRPMPWCLAASYAFYFSVTAYGGSLLIETGASMRRVLFLVGAFSILDSIVEMYGVEAGAFSWYAYNGPNPASILGLPVYMIVFNGATVLLSGLAVSVARPHLRGWRWGLVVPGVSVVYGGASVVLLSPSWFAINQDWSDGAMWVAGLISAGLAFAVPYLLVRARLARPNAGRADGSYASDLLSAHDNSASAAAAVTQVGRA